MKHIVLLLISTSFCLVARSQKSFVTVTVTDSLQLVPDEIIYMVAYLNESSFYATDSTIITTDTEAIPAQQTQPDPQPLLEVRAVVRKMRLDTLSETSYTVNNIDYYKPGQSIRLRFTSLNALQRFVQQIKNIKYITGVVVELRMSTQDAGNKQLLQKLMEKARTEAETLAGLAGKKLGTVHSVTESQAGNNMLGWTSYPPLSALADKHYEASLTSNDRLTTYKTLTVTFNWRLHTSFVGRI